MDSRPGKTPAICQARDTCWRDEGNTADCGPTCEARESSKPYGFAAGATAAGDRLQGRALSRFAHTGHGRIRIPINMIFKEHTCWA